MFPIIVGWNISFRLKLYDQSFTRSLNVYDDYRPRPVPVAPEPVKQDLIDNEILESVPKTMKAKVQLLLKKMKSSPDISFCFMVFLESTV
jgi:hypothetical protein